MTTSGTVRSTDGTAIAYERVGAGPALILVDCAGHYREFSSFDGLVAPLAGHFTVYRYDRRPPIETNESSAAQAAFTVELARRVTAGPAGDAVGYFLTGCGVPDEIVTGMRAGHAWSAMEKVAHTLVYDAVISEATTRRLLASVTVPTLILDSQGSPDDLAGMAATVAAWLPNSSHQSLAGTWHGVPEDVLAPILIDYFQR
jgi:hypothetical protein